MYAKRSLGIDMWQVACQWIIRKQSIDALFHCNIRSDVSYLILAIRILMRWEWGVETFFALYTISASL